MPQEKADPHPTVRNVLRVWMQLHGYDGLYTDDCGCQRGDLAPCSQDFSNCKFGYKQKCSCDTTEGACDLGPQNFHIGPEYDPERTSRGGERMTGLQKYALEKVAKNTNEVDGLLITEDGNLARLFALACDNKHLGPGHEITRGLKEAGDSISTARKWLEDSDDGLEALTEDADA